MEKDVRSSSVVFVGIKSPLTEWRKRADIATISWGAFKETSWISWRLKMGPIGRPETSVRYHQYRLRDNLEVRRPRCLLKL
jgi:hypothetical protein